MGPPLKRSRAPSIEDLAFAAEKILDYYFDDDRLCIIAIKPGPNRQRLARIPSIPNFGDDAELAAAARGSGLSRLLYASGVKDKTLATTIKALLGAISEDTDDEVDVLRAAYALGLEEVEEEILLQGNLPTEEGAAVEQKLFVEENFPVGQDLLGVEEFKFVKCASSVPIVESLL